MSPGLFNNNVNLRSVAINNIIYTNGDNIKLYPYIVSPYNNVETYAIIASPLHGRSIIIDFDSILNKYIITKGNGLTYFPFGFISTEEYEDHYWGLLSKKDAIRDYNSGNYIRNLGIFTNEMDAVFSLQKQKLKYFNKITEIEPFILQYKITCPYRISDIPFLSDDLVLGFIRNWDNLFDLQHREVHCNAAEVLISNIRIMHENDVLHNAIHSQNYTLSLELLDFELSRTPITPYENENDEFFYKKLQKREIIQSLEIINQLAFYFKENLNINQLGKIMIKYGFEPYLY
jgi:hypothetical protein